MVTWVLFSGHELTAVPGTVLPVARQPGGVICKFSNGRDETAVPGPLPYVPTPQREVI